MSVLRERVAVLDPKRIDAMFALAIIVELELELWLSHGIPTSHRVLTAVAVVFCAAPIALRRVSPSSALAFCAAVAAIQALLGGNLVWSLTGFLVVPIALGYSAGAWLGLRRSLVALLVGAGLFAVGVLLSADTAMSSGGGSVTEAMFYVILLLTAPWLVGRAARGRSRRVAAFRELATQAAAEDDAREHAAIAAERTRIGHELQDIIAHSISEMVVQAGSARRLLRTDPERARDSILIVEHTGRHALADMRRLLGLLRKDEDPRALVPQPGLDQLAALLDSMREAGVECVLRTQGEPVDLTPGIDLVGYRLIEAALVSAAQHRSSQVVVTVRYQPDWLELEIGGDGSMPNLQEDPLGMSERVALYDGSLRMLPTGGDGFIVQARIPLGTPILA